MYPYIYYFLFEKKSDKSVLYRTVLLIACSVILTLGIYLEAPEYFENVSKALPRLAVFLTGCCAGKYVYEKKHISIVIPVMSWVVFGISLVFAIKHGWQDTLAFRYVYWIGGVAVAFLLAIILCWMPEWFNKVWRCLGAVSLELYFTHIVLRRVLRETFLSVYLKEHYLFKILFVLIGSFIWAEIVAKLVSCIKEKRKYKS